MSCRFRRCHPRIPPGSLGFSLLELVVVVLLVSIFFVAVASRLWALQVDAERTAMENVVGALNAALGIKFAQYVIKHDRALWRSLEKSNPMDQLAQLPKNYLGELDETQTSTIEAGNWYFDLSTHYLVYRVKNEAYFKSSLNPPGARFKIEFVGDARSNTNGILDPGKDVIAGLRLVAVEPYAWTN